MDKINIAHITTPRRDQLSGSDRVILSILSKSDKKKFNHIVFCLTHRENKGYLLIEEVKKIGATVETIILKWRFDIRAFCILRSLLKKYNISILQTYEYKSNFIALFSTFFIKAKKIARIGGWLGFGLSIKSCNLDRKAFIYELIDSFVRKCFDRVVVVSTEIKDKLVAQRCAKDKIVLIHNGTDLDEYYQNSADSTNVKKTLSIKSGAKIIGTIGRLTIEKGHRYLLEAAVEVLQKYPDAKFVIVGEGELKRALFDYSKKLGIEHSIIFTGFSENVGKYLSIMDIFVFPSIWEGFGIVVIEAMAAGIPVIATKVGGIPDIIENNETGILVEAKNSPQLTKAINLLLSDGEKCEFFKNNAKKIVRDKFSSKVMIEKYEEMYNNLVATYGNI